jgi:tRNA wybutosine-synthesizing protein 4
MSDSSQSISIPAPRQTKKGPKSASSSSAAPIVPGTPSHTRAVIGTSDDAAISKLSACQLGYLVDPFLKYFVPHASRRPPLINRGYFSRVAAVWKILQEFCTSNPDQKKQIVSLGAGSDTNYFKLKSLGIAPYRYYEIDFPEAMSKKASIIEKQTELLTLATTKSQHHQHSVAYTPGQLHYPDYFLIPGDLCELNKIQSQLEAVEIDYSLPTLFLSECVLIYMRTEDSFPLIQWSAKQFTGASIFVCYEQILPNDPFGLTMINNLNTRGCKLLGYEKYPDLAAHKERYLTAGYQVYEGWDMNEIYRYFLDPKEVKRIEKLELFDEFEEWHMIQAHYHISMAVKEESQTTNKKWETIGIIRRSKIQQTAETNSNDHSERPHHHSIALDQTIHHFYPKLDVNQSPVNPLIEAHTTEPEPAILINREKVDS